MDGGEVRSVVVIGAGLAGANAALELRRLGFTGAVTLIGAEAHPPYQRPPLSKQFLRGEQAFDDLLVAPSQRYRSLAIETRLGREATALEARSRSVQLDGGEVIHYDRAIIATGGRKRRLRFLGADLEGVFDLRTVDDCERLKAIARPGSRAVVVGLGFIGCEVAASLRMLGLEVTAVDPGPAPLAKVLGPEVGRALADLHRERGVELVLGEGVERFEGGGRVERVATTSGRRIAADLVVAGIGIEPEAELLKAAGARISNGVEVDELCRTSLPGVFAAGDVADHLHPLFGRIRVEHYNNAEKQGRAAAAAALGQGRPYEYVHSFWSDQFDEKLEYVGLATRWTRIGVEGSLERRDFIVRYYDGDRLLAAAAMGRGGDPESEEPSELKDIAGEIRQG